MSAADEYGELFNFLVVDDDDPFDWLSQADIVNSITDRCDAK